jgi:hypothetical protein
MAPVSQKADSRPISFYLDDQVSGGSPIHVPLVVRPEDLSRSEPGLITATPTLGGAFIDDFGPGISTIQISGHTGWNLGNGWEKQFAELRDNVWVQWHSRRADAVKRGRDPNDVKLIFSDALDSIVCVVAPSSFSLKRNRSRPLLMMYQISLIVVSEQLSAVEKDALHIGGTGSQRDDSVVNGIASLSASISKIQKAAANIHALVDANLAAPARNFLALTNTALNKVLTAVRSAAPLTSAVGEEAQQFIGIARDLSLAGRNLFYAYNAVAALPDFVRVELSEVASAFENAFCVLSNAFSRVKLYPNYDSVYGASVCSSTVGGSALSPYADQNTFEAILSRTSAAPTVTAAAQSAIARLHAMDPVLAPRNVGQLVSDTSAVWSGVGFP